MLKILTSGVLALSLGMSMLGFSRDETATPTDASALDCLPACMEDCDATVERLPDGTCRVDCIDENGEACWAIVACDPNGTCEVLERSANCELPECDLGGCEQSASDTKRASECSTAAARPSCDGGACPSSAAPN